MISRVAFVRTIRRNASRWISQNVPIVKKLSP